MITLDEARTQAAPVVHLKVAPFDVRIDRAGAWGNPHPLKTPKDHRARCECLLAYVRTMRLDVEALRRVGALKGQTLGCWCAPKLCHGDVLASLAVAETVEDRVQLLDAWEDWLRAQLEEVCHA